MSLAIVHTRARLGINAPPVTVEVHLSNGLPGLSIVGLPEAAVKESKDRVRSALLNSHFEFPAKRITINLAPADLPKEGGRFDLPIAIGILAASGQIPLGSLETTEFIGELALSGALRAVAGILPASIACGNAARNLIVANNNAQEAALNQQTTVLGSDQLLEVCAHLQGQTLIEPTAFNAPTPATPALDLIDVKGQHQAKRALEVAAAGGHNLLLYGPPGTGKTMLASRLPGILPPLSMQQSIEVASLYSISNQVSPPWQLAPFRAPHHSASAVALVGGGSHPKPGEISLAHHGILFLDELPEFQRSVLEVLREPLESGAVSISRANAQVTFPARFQLIAAMNPCPCGYLTHKNKQRCQCTADQIRRYRQKISGPLLDRIDLHIPVNSLDISQLQTAGNTPTGESSAVIRQRVLQARAWQHLRQQTSNAQLTPKALAQYCPLGSSEKALLKAGAERLSLSARAYYRLLKTARTLADLAQSDDITCQHISEAFSFRNLKQQ